MKTQAKKKAVKKPVAKKQVHKPSQAKASVAPTPNEEELAKAHTEQANKDQAQERDIREAVMGNLRASGSFIPLALEADAARKEVRDVERMGAQMQQKLSFLNQQIDSLEKARHLLLQDMEVQQSDLRTVNIQLCNKLNALHRAANESEPYNRKSEGLAQCEPAGMGTISTRY